MGTILQQQNNDHEVFMANQKQFKEQIGGPNVPNDSKIELNEQNEKKDKDNKHLKKEV